MVRSPASLGYDLALSKVLPNSISAVAAQAQIHKKAPISPILVPNYLYLRLLCIVKRIEEKEVKEAKGEK